ncbi:3-phosphoshikimate 1-carboxyvinyltransferase [Thermobrachium celere]|uniref:3-phosphoshikimate 1-carboxyvinyltransferase n=1 Tax=Thermobrachium celere TaxID=53422 RepID=UPI0019416803|nr:3-phosphoshikimate 1-carboxyvinyltransferase [Thermobrachium celere]GFR36194.1 3-phosphoshikimate 1-carboxyvinyltransferase [Thermobrachium celere]
MNSIKIIPRKLKGVVDIPPSKSISHRAIICAGLSEGKSIIENIIFSDDISATIEGIKSFGVDLEFKKAKETYDVLVNGKGKVNLINDIIDCRESGSTLRFLIPIALMQNKEVTFVGRGKLCERPLDVYYKLFKQKGIEFRNENGRLPLKVKGPIMSGTYEVEGNISSQFITGLLFVLPLLDGDSKIIITTNLESKGYVDLTLDVLKSFGIEIVNDNYRQFLIKGNQRYKATHFKVEGDYSQAAFWLTAGVLGEEVVCRNLNLNSLQGDRVIIDIIKAMGGNITIEGQSLISNTSNSKGIVVDVSQCPDLTPIITVLAALSNGTTRIVNARRLRIKESDRLKAIATELNKLGAEVLEFEDGLVINGKEMLDGGIVDSWNDHRIAMALAIASIRCKKPVIIQNYDCVKKSYPNFFEHFKELGGEVYE